MNTTELYESVSEELNVTKAEATRLVKGFLDGIQNVLEKNESVSIPNLGTFDTHFRDERKAYNPHYQAYLLLPPKKVVDFRPSSSLRDILDETEEQS